MTVDFSAYHFQVNLPINYFIFQGKATAERSECVERRSRQRGYQGENFSSFCFHSEIMLVMKASMQLGHGKMACVIKEFLKNTFCVHFPHTDILIHLDSKHLSENFDS